MGFKRKISAKRVDVFPGRLRILVQLSDGALRWTTEELVAVACDAYPTLMLHSCINSKGPTFGDVAVGTSVPHLLEHLVIAEQVRLSGEGRNDLPSSVAPEVTFVGTTEWIEGGPQAGEAVVEVSFVDDLQALKALSNALEFLNANM